jgi:hypothetical protein
MTGKPYDHLRPKILGRPPPPCHGPEPDLRQMPDISGHMPSALATAIRETRAENASPSISVTGPVDNMPFGVGAGDELMGH